MKKSTVLLGIAGLVIALNCACTQKQLDRAGLIEMMDRYLEALVKHDPAAVPLAENARLVENIEAAAIGEGLWETASGGPTDFKIYVADPVAESVGFMGVCLCSSELLSVRRSQRPLLLRQAAKSSRVFCSVAG